MSEVEMTKAAKREQKTQQKIIDAFFDLLNEKPFDGVSVVDICKRANVNRGTFYLYYLDKQTLLAACVNKMLKSFSLNGVQKSITEDIAGYYTSVVDVLVDFLTTWRTEIKAMVAISDNAIILDTIHAATITELQATLLQLKNAKRPVPISIDLASEFLAGGFIALAKKWILTDNSITEKEFREYVNKLITNLLAQYK